MKYENLICENSIKFPSSLHEIPSSFQIVYGVSYPGSISLLHFPIVSEMFPKEYHVLAGSILYQIKFSGNNDLGGLAAMQLLRQFLCPSMLIQSFFCFCNKS